MYKGTHFFLFLFVFMFCSFSYLLLIIFVFLILANNSSTNNNLLTYKTLFQTDQKKMKKKNTAIKSYEIFIHW